MDDVFAAESVGKVKGSRNNIQNCAHNVANLDERKHQNKQKGLNWDAERF
jgi:hypothetical protein